MKRPKRTAPDWQWRVYNLSWEVPAWARKQGFKLWGGVSLAWRLAPTIILAGFIAWVVIRCS